MEPTVLFVDDEPNILHASLRNLREQPYQILTAVDAASAKLILQTHQVHLIVSDECMPGQSGTQLLKWVAKEMPSIVRIVLTGQPVAEVAIRAINECNVFRFLQKPCHPLELAVAIREGLEASACSKTMQPGAK